MRLARTLYSPPDTLRYPPLQFLGVSSREFGRTTLIGFVVVHLGVHGELR
jgi:hypothetical protein